MSSDREAPDAQKRRVGLHRLTHAFGYSLNGLRLGIAETAFRQECVLAAFMFPAAFFLGRSWVEVSLLCFSLVFVLVTELLNTGIESAIDRFGGEWHELSKRAKDLGSAAVLLSLIFCAGVWIAAAVARLS